VEGVKESCSDLGRRGGGCEGGKLKRGGGYKKLDGTGE
jgi:hypothetical protein